MGAGSWLKLELYWDFITLIKEPENNEIEVICSALKDCITKINCLFNQ